MGLKKTILKTSSILILLLNTAYATTATTNTANNAAQFPPSWSNLFADLKNDYSNFYSLNNLLKLGGAFAVGAVLANTSADQSVSNWYQKDIRNNTTDTIAKIFKTFGTAKYVAIGYVGISATALIFRHSQFGQSLGKFSVRYLEAMAVGLPPLWLTQELTGGDRPSGTYGSHWHPFRCNHGVSGHAFLGAVPFITAAKMTQQPVLKVIFYGLSTLAGLSRINDNLPRPGSAHYLSQVMLGWTLAYLSTSAVFDSKYSIQITPTINQFGGVGISASKSFAF